MRGKAHDRCCERIEMSDWGSFNIRSGRGMRKIKNYQGTKEGRDKKSRERPMEKDEPKCRGLKHSKWWIVEEYRLSMALEESYLL